MVAVRHRRSAAQRHTSALPTCVSQRQQCPGAQPYGDTAQLPSYVGCAGSARHAAGVGVRIHHGSGARVHGMAAAAQVAALVPLVPCAARREAKSPQWTRHYRGWSTQVDAHGAGVVTYHGRSCRDAAVGVGVRVGCQLVGAGIGGWQYHTYMTGSMVVLVSKLVFGVVVMLQSQTQRYISLDFFSEQVAK